jgi:ABC-type dipeptide/oligopeptide/nickel transport system permease subunit/ABC-type glycerol-3-phosphate transport system substrate-binding protein
VGKAEEIIMAEPFQDKVIRSLLRMLTSFQEFWRLYRKNRMAVIGGAIVIAFVLLAILAPYVTSHDPETPNFLAIRKPPAWLSGGSWTYPLGTDHLGRDILTRIIYGARVSLLVGFIVVCFATIVGVILGLISGYFGGKVDAVIQRVIDTLLAFPYLILATALVAVLGPGLRNIIIALLYKEWIYPCRVVRGEVLVAKEQEYVEAARTVGAGDRYIMFKEILPNILASTIVVSTLRVATVILIKLQERDVARKSSPTLFPVFDQGDPTVEPYDPVLIRLNAIGGYRWKNPGDWLSWDFVVPEDGLYKIAVKAKQDQQHGFYSNRKVLIDGAVPFQEVKAVSFPYSTYHRMYPLGVDESGNPVLFYLDKGQHELQLEVVLGGVADLLREAEDILYDLNTVYRRIIMITSPTPDPLRSYQLEKRIPGIIKQLGSLSEAVEGLAEKLEMMTGERGSHAATLTRISTLLERMSERPYTIPRLLGEYRDNVAALGAWIIQTQNQPLMIDYVIIASPNEPLPEAIPTTKDILRHERMAFLASFTHDYSRIGDMGSTSTQAQSIKVWIGSGRDQAQILKQMIEDTLTPQTGIHVDLELVESLSDPAGGGSATGAGGGGATSVMGNLLIPSTLAGTAPDVALGAANMDLAFRGAVVDLTQFPDFEEIAKRFKKSAFLPFRFRDKVFALPEVQGFPMLFYRKDILAELRIDIPQTWDDVYELIPELTKENLQFGIPAGMATYLMFLYQKGVALFKPDVVATNLDAEIAIQTFIELTDLFTLYNQPLVYNAENRFRLGEMPLVIANYDLLNTLSIFAPELRGEWGFTMVPGTRMPDGTINRTVAVTATQAAPGAVAVPPGTSGAIIMEQSENKQAAWEFLKWWTSEATQLRFGREMESLLGAAARYATANVQAFERLPWRAEERQVLLQQWDWVEGIPPVLGAYYVNRQFDWLFRSVVLQHERAREAVHDYNRPANEEIARKRKEFGLETSLDDLPDMWVDVYWSQYTHVNRLD